MKQKPMTDVAIEAICRDLKNDGPIADWQVSVGEFTSSKVRHEDGNLIFVFEYDGRTRELVLKPIEWRRPRDTEERLSH